MPTPYTDRYDLPLSTSSALAAGRYRDGVDLLLSLWPGASEALDEAIAADPDFALAHAARARLQLIDNQAGAARGMPSPWHSGCSSDVAHRVSAAMCRSCSG